MKKLSPMDDKELKNNLESDENTLVNNGDGRGLENVFELNSPNNTVYGDFSMNSFLIVDTPEEEKKEDTSYVYMESIIDLIRGLNTKIDTLKSEKSEEKHILERVMSFLTIGDSQSAEEVIQTYNNQSNSASTEILVGLIQKTLPQFFINLKEELLNIKEIGLLLKKIYIEKD